ncbi:MAG TPA: cbb3-type cytochrome c oxidase subunit I [Vicinamibacterales bacterium]|nr:cbb3-type cytochrome c oxidase subunit I [Vicinamibacterales bacterium]
MHGTLVTASHGHFAFYGAFSMLVFAAMTAMLPALGFQASASRRAMVSYWLMNTGMAAMVLAFTIAGVVQVYLHRMIGLDGDGRRLTRPRPQTSGPAARTPALRLPARRRSPARGRPCARGRYLPLVALDEAFQPIKCVVPLR